MIALAHAAVAFLTDALLRGTIVLLLTAGIARAARRASAAVRHRIWAIGLAGALVAPILVPFLAPLQDLIATPRLPALSLSAAAPPILSVSEAQAVTNAPANPSVTVAATDSLAKAVPTIGGGPVADVTDTSALAPTAAILLTIYLTGALIFLLQLLSEMAEMRRLRAGSNIVEVRSVLGQCMVSAFLALRLDHPIDLRISRADAQHYATGPMTWGYDPAVVLLPADAAAWPEERLRAALLHEAAHIRRRDFEQWLLLGRITAALYWCHPLVHFAVRQLRAESERASDDLVLTAGQVPGPEYAAQLLEVARTLRPGRTVEPAIAMVRRPEIEERLRAILSPRLNRHEATGRLRIGLILGAWVLLGGASLLRAAGAYRPAPRHPSTIVLSNGMTVRLVGLCELGEQRWWQPDGSPLTQLMPRYEHKLPSSLLTGKRWLLVATSTSYDETDQPHWQEVPNPREPGSHQVRTQMQFPTFESYTLPDAMYGMVQKGGPIAEEHTTTRVGTRVTTLSITPMAFSPFQGNITAVYGIGAGPWQSTFRASVPIEQHQATPEGDLNFQIGPVPTDYLPTVKNGKTVNYVMPPAYESRLSSSTRLIRVSGYVPAIAQPAPERTTTNAGDIDLMAIDAEGNVRADSPSGFCFVDWQPGAEGHTGQPRVLLNFAMDETELAPVTHLELRYRPTEWASFPDVQLNPTAH